MNDEEIPHFRARAQVVTRLGEELITDSTQALLELIKNAYDADARTVRVDVNTTEITEVPKLAEDDDAPATDVESDAAGGDVAVSDGANGAPHEASNDDDEQDGTRQEVDRLAGWVRIVDSGFGMDRAAIDNGWLTLSASPKRELKDAGGKTTGGRTPLGDKGLGRLGAQRLGDLVRLRTRPTRPPGHVPADPQDASGHPMLSIGFRFVSAASRRRSCWRRSRSVGTRWR